MAYLRRPKFAIPSTHPALNKSSTGAFPPRPDQTALPSTVHTTAREKATVQASQQLDLLVGLSLGM